MKIELVPSVAGTADPQQFCHGVIIDETLAIDAGTLGLLWPVERQSQIEDVFLSHSHLDHVATLGLFLDNVYQPGDECPTIHACPATEACLREDIFNDRLWPDFFRISAEETPFLKLTRLVPEQAVAHKHLTVTPVPLDHPVPTMGFIVEDADASVAFVSDTRPTDRIWELFRQTANPRAVFLECSFPDSHHWLADKAGHLCPELVNRELAKLPDSVAVIACHLKPAHYDETTSELAALDRDNLEVGIPGRTYQL